jgi:hypothetical protein
MVTVVFQGIMAQQAATGVAAGGVGGSRIGVPRAGEYDELTGEPIVGGNRRPRPIFPPLDWPHSTSNVDTNRYKDNKRDEDNKCKLFPYSERGAECKDGNAHHIVPDRAWRSPGQRGSISTGSELVNDGVDDLLQKMLPWRRGGYYYGARMDEETGLCICVPSEEHREIHKDYDQRERALGASNTPQWTAKLGDLEDMATTSVSKATGCDKAKMQEQLRSYHQRLGFDSDTMVRADPSGRSGLTMEKFAETLSKQVNQGPTR